jgi:autoinducer 2-degrading protein
MLVLHVTNTVKPEHVNEYLEMARYDAEHSRQDEPGCLRFDVVIDRDMPNRFYFYEVYRDEAALEAHRQTAHFRRYFEQVQPWLASPPERRFGINVIPSDDDWR